MESFHVFGDHRFVGMDRGRSYPRFVLDTSEGQVVSHCVGTSDNFKVAAVDS